MTLVQTMAQPQMSYGRKEKCSYTNAMGFLNKCNQPIDGSKNNTFFHNEDAMLRFQQGRLAIPIKMDAHWHLLHSSNMDTVREYVKGGQELWQEAAKRKQLDREQATEQRKSKNKRKRR